MRKAVLISIKPEWCELIASGKKTVEVRKSRPKIETPFKCYIYCSKNGISIYGDGKSYVTDYSKLLEKGAKKGFETASGFFKWNGKVIGEFVCKHIYTYSTCDSADGMSFTDMDITEMSCMTKNELEAYEMSAEPKENTVYKVGLFAWRISDLKIYDKPKELPEFNGLRTTKFGYEPVEIKRAPQSWCYVEESEDK